MPSAIPSRLAVSTEFLMSRYAFLLASYSLISCGENLAISAANDTRYGRNELKYVRTIDIKVLRKEADTYAKQYRELDLKIQSLNWTVDLVDLQDLPR